MGATRDYIVSTTHSISVATFDLKGITYRHTILHHLNGNDGSMLRSNFLTCPYLEHCPFSMI